MCVRACLFVVLGWGMSVSADVMIIFLLLTKNKMNLSGPGEIVSQFCIFMLVAVVQVQLYEGIN